MEFTSHCGFGGIEWSNVVDRFESRFALAFVSGGTVSVYQCCVSCSDCLLFAAGGGDGRQCEMWW